MSTPAHRTTEPTTPEDHGRRRDEPPHGGARSDWEARIARRSDQADRVAIPDLDPPRGLEVVAGAGHVLLRWQPVPGAVGYLVHRAHGDGALEPVDHRGGDVLAVPDTWYVDTTGEPGRAYRYAVASVPEVTVTGRTGEEVTATPGTLEAQPPQVRAVVSTGAAGTPLHRPWQPMIGSERLSQLLCRDTSGGRPIGTELFESLRRARAEIGVETVRAHAILHDDLGVYREVEGEPVHDFSRVGRVYDMVIGLGLRPVVEVGFMPRDLASDPDRTVFEYGGIISPPKDYDRWADLVSALVEFLRDRYGVDEVAGWDFEVWNEANLEVFWSSTREEWMRLYDVTAAAVKRVDPRIAVGGPSSAAAGWVDDLLAHARSSGAPVDFVSTHTYGNAPLDLRPTLERHGYGDARITWTEWGVTPTHFNPVNDAVSSATFLLHGMRSAAGRLDALSYWVASDHFEELGRPPRLLHGGFGLISVGGIAKPRYHALHLLARLGGTELPVTWDGDGADGLVRAWASRRDDGGLAVLVWNHTLDQTKSDGDPTLARRLHLELPGLAGRQVTTTRLDADHGDLSTLASRLGVGDWPTDEQWDELRTVDRLQPVQATLDDDGALLLDLPQPAAVLVEVPPTA